VDIIPPTPEAVADRKLTLLPGLFAPRADLVEALAKSGAVVLMGPRSGSKTPDFHIPADLPPGALRSLIDLKVRRVESLRSGAVIPIPGCDAGHFEGWREFLVLGEKVEAELKSADGEVALARSNLNFYLAGRPNESLVSGVLRRLIARAGLACFDLHQDIRIRDNGAMRYVFNYDREAQDISKIVGDASLLLGDRRLPPCGVAVFRRTPGS
jgi:beta-galactosidase